MDKISFTFPDHDSLWQFKNQTQAINVAITPKKNRISGLFHQHDVELAVNKFNAVSISEKNISSTTNHVRRGSQDWFRISPINYIDGVKRLKRVISSLQSLKLF